jgi:hypothetical protein
MIFKNHLKLNQYQDNNAHCLHVHFKFCLQSFFVTWLHICGDNDQNHVEINNCVNNLMFEQWGYFWDKTLEWLALHFLCNITYVSIMWQFQFQHLIDRNWYSLYLDYGRLCLLHSGKVQVGCFIDFIFLTNIFTRTHL